MLSLKKSLPLVLFIPVLLTAWSTSSLAGTQNTSGEMDSLFNDLQVETKPSYGLQVKRAIDAQLGYPTKYKGKSCTVQLKLKRSGRVESTTVEKGDAAFCKTFISAIYQAKIPEAPDEQTWQKFSNMTVDFIPYK
ncbi:cell envelope integrity TolA C-terminal domain-containing protein [Klebsiella sp. BIGb0407]|uniref:cell envelope integrity TolA C-terminal domain-containing protein n=1 Tax=Klebsiella sp. BIGb0407 TaxID=2940603 RepID=UPI0021673E13|nr:cell envelope integrity TolA C-terminal domain-containing protein [Klebsiella sp. BIGb0407]MCS3430081.1 colicin import membrane protein [Klebsiella sp. BIGb0407]